MSMQRYPPEAVSTAIRFLMRLRVGTRQEASAIVGASLQPFFTPTGDIADDILDASLSDTEPPAITFGGGGTAGTGATASRGDHTHDGPTNPVTAHEAAADPHTGYLLESLLDAKGDLISASADNTPARRSVGTDGQFLVADSGQATGLNWSTHGATGDPHSQYATDTDLSTHAAASDPHTGYILESLLDAKGDLIAASAADTPARVAVGTDGQALLADSGETAGVRWGDVATSGQYRAWLYTSFSAGEFTYVVDGSGNPVYGLMDLE